MKTTATGLFLSLFLALSLAFAANVNAQRTQTGDSVFLSDFPDRYVVVKGDTLWDISGRFLKSPWLWPDIWYANPQIENPHLIYPGDVITRVIIDGQERLTVKRTERLINDGTVRLSPQIRSEPTDEAIPAIPLDQINSFLSRSRILEDGVIEAAPYVLGGQEKRLILGTGDRIYARGEFADNIPSYGLYRKGQVYIDPETEEILGIEAIDIGGANMRAVNDDIGTLSVTRSVGEVRVGDRILPTTERLVDTTFFPAEPRKNIEGEIISVEGGVSLIGLLDVVVINRGERDGLNVGNVLAILKEGETVRDNIIDDNKKRSVKLPDEQAGMLMVFQSFEKMSLAIVLNAERGINIGDSVRNP